MPTTTRLVEVLPSRLAHIATRVDERRRELGLTQKELADLYNQAVADLYAGEPPGSVPPMTRERVAKIIMARRAAARSSAAKALYPHELRLLAHALKLPLESLVGPHPAQPIIAWDPLTEPQRAQHVLNLIRHHEAHAAERRSWAEFLPCSFETPEFMHAHHAAIFRTTTASPAMVHDARSVVALYDEIGAANRERSLTLARTRDWTYTHHMFLSDLTRIAEASEEYQSFAADLRRSCLQHLIALLSDRTCRLRLIIAEDGAAPDVKRQLRSFDSLFLAGQTLASWRDHGGTFYWSEHPRIIAAKRGSLDSLALQARYRKQRDVIQLLTRLLRSINAGHGQPSRKSGRRQKSAA